MKTWHWAIVAAVLTAIWIGFMIWMSYESYRDKDPKLITPELINTETVKNSSN